MTATTAARRKAVAKKKEEQKQAQVVGEAIVEEIRSRRQKWARCSSIPRVLVCGASAEEPALPYNPPSDASELGTGANVALDVGVAGVDPDLESIAKAYEVDLDELSIRYHLGMRIWRKLPAWLAAQGLTVDPSRWQTAKRLDGAICGGTTDLWYDDGTLRIIPDWKAGRATWADHSGQLLGYALAARQQEGDRATVLCLTIYILDEEIEPLWVTPQMLDAFEARLSSQLNGAGYAPGDACRFCPRQLTCEARQAWSRDAVQSLQVVDGTQALSVERLAELYQMIPTVEAAIARVRDAVRAEVQNAGAFVLSDTKQLELREVEKKSLDAQAAWPVLTRAGFSKADINACLSLSLTNVNKVAAERAKAAGEKIAAAKDRLLSELDAAGAVTRSSYPKLTQVKRSKP